MRIQVPRVIKSLRTRSQNPVLVKDIVSAMVEIASFHALFNSLETKTRFVSIVIPSDVVVC